MNKINLIWPLLAISLTLLLISCVPSGALVNYHEVSVEEEGGINFTQITRSDENLVFPNIFTNTDGMLRWYAAPMIAVSNDHERIAYMRRENSFNNIIIRNLSGGQATTQRTFNRDILDMSFSPDDRWIAFTERGGSGNSGVRTINMINATEGAAIRQVTSQSDGVAVGPMFAPDGESIYFTKQHGDRYFIWNTNLNTSIQTQYSSGFTPALTPDGENLIVTRNSSDGKGRGEIWMINMNSGSETVIIRDSEIGFSSPNISPDGETIVMVGTTRSTSNRPQNLDLYSVRINGTQLQQLTFHGGHDVSPVWSPGGNHVYFLAQRGNEDGKFNVWRMNFPEN
ncbi:hypothetical protein DYD21_13400 [Rhodohalobacter sp. SW132]|uniref:PD40 domain-containing protein n=1 Tax=Rhodohalobacter sp. SW132 TaxID=2293433 RepID=UPI000E22AFA7|nr:PD40 domain-containing protein [Rhodohalobacter sp. SW132]REL32817.1 hypothetical protein DYD21_13400 [Rhodohalobacter sp. SW132]